MLNVKRKKSLNILLCFLFFSSFYLPAQTSPEDHLDFKVGSEQSDLDKFILEKMKANHIPGLAACIVKNDKLVWANEYGWADIENKIPMTEYTIQNIGSISKTVTATAIMQLWETGKFKLDDDVNLYLPFKVRNPAFPDDPITFRQLLAHKSSIKDGKAYQKSYACGDPTISLKDWIEGYFTPEGKYYDAKDNFHTWKPGVIKTPRGPEAYTNVGYGLLGYLVEVISGMNFAEYCKKHIFAPLGMTHTGWYLADIDVSKHAIPYSYYPENFKQPEGITVESLLPRYGKDKQSLEKGTYFAHCLYSFPNYPDGLVRTSVRELSLFLRAYINHGTFKGVQILQKETIASMLSDKHFSRGLCWYPQRYKGGISTWGHGGSDPGISTQMCFVPEDGIGVIIFSNCDSPGNAYGEIINRLIAKGLNSKQRKLNRNTDLSWNGDIAIPFQNDFALNRRTDED
ncbi:MAG: serine hydrolase [Deltaproteobacteria bacterium]|nr:serine hydrolase [Deltaproteobacteria bacterium]